MSKSMDHLPEIELIEARVRVLYDELEREVADYRAQQTELGRQYAVHGHKPAPYSSVTKAAIERIGGQSTEDVAYAWTSGTTREPKKILYSQIRLKALQDHYADQLLLAAHAAGVLRPSFHFLSSFNEDRSVSGLLTRTVPSSTLAMALLRPCFVLRAAAMSLANKYSAASLHWAQLLIIRPSVIAAVNPSSLSGLLKLASESEDEIRNDALAILDESAVRNAINMLPPDFEMRRKDTAERLRQDSLSGLQAWLPGLKLVFCWQGGYVRPYLEQLRLQLAHLRPTFAPMFSLSTETVAYSHYQQIAPRGGLPVYPGICYEFLPAEADSNDQDLIPPWELREGAEYRMVVSDAYGLTRYDTHDVFLCLGHVGEVPQLDFRRRHGLAYSFTGEKLTDLHLLDAYAELSRQLDFPAAMFTCFPTAAPGALPGYVFVWLTDNHLPEAASIAPRLDEILRGINCEYDEKRASGRLTPARLVYMSTEELMARLAAASPRYVAASPAQFKLLPLYDQLWERIFPSNVETHHESQ